MKDNIELMKKSEIEQLPEIEWDGDDIECDSLVLLPTNMRYQNTLWSYYYVIPCRNNQPLGKLLYDTHSLFTAERSESIGIDCLKVSGLMRIFFDPSYVFQPVLHQTTSKNSKFYIK